LDYQDNLSTGSPPPEGRSGRKLLALTAFLGAGALVVIIGSQLADFPGGGPADSEVAAADSLEDPAPSTPERSDRDYRRVSEEKDTLIQTLQTAMVLFNELTNVEREISGGERERPAEGAELESWDQRVRGQLDRLRARYGQLASDLSRAERRLRTLEGSDATLRASLADAVRTATAMRQDNQQKQALIDQLAGRLESVTAEKDAAVALSVARADTIQELKVENRSVYWIAGTEEELRRLGMIETVGGRNIVFTRVGETLAPSRGADPSQFDRLDRYSDRLVRLPDDGEYEIITPQKLEYLDANASALRLDGRRGFVRHELRVGNPLFWESAPYLILVRR
jgi:hypothetical protein